MLGRVGEAMRGWAPLKLVAIVLAVAVIVGLAWWLWPRGEGGPSENVRFDYVMEFSYLGSEENVPLENFALNWSAPKVDNSLVELIDGKITWQLYYIEDDNTQTLEATYGGIVNLRGERTSQLEMYQFGYEEYTDYGPVYNAWFDRLYPREVFVRLGYLNVDKETADKLTLKVYGQTAPIASWWAIGQENQRINFAFWVGLWRENVLVEQFQWTQENMTYGSSWLWPVT